VQRSCADCRSLLRLRIYETEELDYVLRSARLLCADVNSKSEVLVCLRLGCEGDVVIRLPVWAWRHTTTLNFTIKTQDNVPLLI
jgi:hypothetical protein